jgi:hypothetical protein
LALTTSPAGAAFVQQGDKLVGTDGSASVIQAFSVAVSADGNTLVSAASADSGGGPIWVFVRTGAQWSQQGGRLLGTGSVGNALQGVSVSVSGDGNTILVGGPSDNNSAGAAWVFTRSDGVWTQQAKLVGTGAISTAGRGSSVALSADGNTAVVGGTRDNSGMGAAWVFTRTGTAWTQQAKLVGTGAVGGFVLQGSAVAISADGSTVIVGGPQDNSGIGASWVFRRSGGLWAQEAKLIGLPALSNTGQGHAVALSGDGSTASVCGFNGNRVWVFTRGGAGWAPQGTLVAPSGTNRGRSVALSASGDLAVFVDSDATGQVTSVPVYTRTDGLWTQGEPNLVCSDPAGGVMQRAVALSGDGSTVVAAGSVNADGQGGVWVFFDEGICAEANSTLAGAVEWISGEGNFTDAVNWFPTTPGPTDRVEFPRNGHALQTVNVDTSPLTQSVNVDAPLVTFDLHNSTWRMEQSRACSEPLPGLTVGGVSSGLLLRGGRVIARDARIAPGLGTIILNTGADAPGAELVIEEGPSNSGMLSMGEATDPEVADHAGIHVTEGILRTRDVVVGFGRFDVAEITVDGPRSFWNGVTAGASDDVAIGLGGTGKVDVLNGAKAVLPTVGLGVSEGTGTLSVSGSDSKVTCEVLAVATGSAVTLTDGGTLEVVGASECRGGLGALGGHLTIHGPLTMNGVGDLVVGAAAADIEGGLNVLGNASALVVGSVFNVGGNVNIDGDGAILEASTSPVEVAGDIQIGLQGPGTLKLGEGATVTCVDGVLGLGSEPARGVVEVDGGTWQLSDLKAGVDGDASLSITNNGLVHCLNAYVAADAGSDVTITVTNGARLVVTNMFFLGLANTATLLGGAGAEIHARSLQGRYNASGFTGVCVGCELDIASLRDVAEGATLFCDTLALAAGSVLEADNLFVGAKGVILGAGTLQAPLVNGGTLSPGGSEPDTLPIATDFVQTPAGRIHITLDATHDVVSVAGSATLAGALEVEIGPNAAGGRCEVLIGHPVVGTFDQVPINVSVSYTDTSVVIEYETTATLISLAYASAEPGRVRLAWYAADPPTAVAGIQRRTAFTEWGTIGTSSLDGSGRFEFVDTEVVAGMRYGYRLEMGSGDALEYLGETWVDVPNQRVEFGLTGARPNPTPGDVTVAFSLSDVSPARLDLVDVAGRIVRSREVGALGPGHHVVSLARGGTLAPGVYFTRLVSLGRVANARVVVTQ